MEDVDGSDGVVPDVVTGVAEGMVFRNAWFASQAPETFILFPKFPEHLRRRIGINPDIIPSLRTLFIRTMDGRDLEFLSGIRSVDNILSWIMIRVVEGREANDRRDDESSVDHKAFLDYLGACFWSAFSPEWFLQGDEEVRQLIRQPRHTWW